MSGEGSGSQQVAGRTAERLSSTGYSLLSESLRLLPSTLTTLVSLSSLPLILRVGAGGSEVEGREG